jgi:hypothetical protein
VVRRRLGQQHTFRFSDLDHVSQYLITCPKYQLTADLTSDPNALASAPRQPGSGRRGPIAKSAP